MANREKNNTQALSDQQAIERETRRLGLDTLTAERIQERATLKTEARRESEQPVNIRKQVRWAQSDLARQASHRTRRGMPTDTEATGQTHELTGVARLQIETAAYLRAELAKNDGDLWMPDHWEVARGMLAMAQSPDLGIERRAVGLAERLREVVGDIRDLAEGEGQGGGIWWYLVNEIEPHLSGDPLDLLMDMPTADLPTIVIDERGLGSVRARFAAIYIRHEAGRQWLEDHPEDHRRWEAENEAATSSGRKVPFPAGLAELKATRVNVSARTVAMAWLLAGLVEDQIEGVGTVPRVWEHWPEKAADTPAKIVKQIQNTFTNGRNDGPYDQALRAWRRGGGQKS